MEGEDCGGGGEDEGEEEGGAEPIYGCGVSAEVGCCCVGYGGEGEPLSL